MPSLKMGSANYAVSHLQFKVKEQNIHISIFVLYHSGSGKKKRDKRCLLFIFFLNAYLYPKEVQHISFPLAS